MAPAGQPAADSLVGSFKTIDEAGRARHAAVLDYWLAIRGDREFPPLHELDPLAISDAGPSSALLELIGGGEDAEIRHIGEALKPGTAIERIADAPRPSILASIASKLSIVAISRNLLAFEDEFAAADGTTRCWVTLLPLNSAGPWVDYVYAFVTFETVPAEAEAAPEHEDAPEAAADPQPEPEPVPDDVEESLSTIASQEAESEMDQAEPNTHAADEAVEDAPAEAEATAEPEAPAEAEQTGGGESGPGFSELFHNPATADGFYGAQSVHVAARHSPPPVAEDATPEPAVSTPGALQARLAEVRAKADEARMAKLRSNAALYEGLGAAYDFALDAENHAEEYLKLVEAQGLKIQLRSPMLPVMKLAFEGMCDEPTMARLEAVLAWALEQELPRGTLAERIEAEGGISRILSGEASAT
jgi:hypothetical protein